MNKKLLILLIVFFSIIIAIFLSNNLFITNTAPVPGNYVVLMNGHTSESSVDLSQQPSYIKVYDSDATEKVSYKLTSHWDYINYNENNEMILYNETSEMCGIFEGNSDVVKYPCQDIYSNNITEIVVGGDNSSLYIEKQGAVLYFVDEPYFEEIYNGLNTIYYIIDFVQLQQN